MPIDFSQVQQKLIEKLNSRVADEMPQPGETPMQQAEDFRQAMSAPAQQNAVASAGQGSDPVAGAAPLDGMQASSPGDRILNHLASMSKQTHYIQQVSAKAAAAGGDAGNMLHAQVELAKIAGTAGTVTDAASKSSQSTDALLKSS
jgi:hypothetical protein